MDDPAAGDPNVQGASAKEVDIPSGGANSQGTVQPALQWHGSRDATDSGQDSSKESLRRGAPANDDVPTRDQFVGGVLASLDAQGHGDHGTTVIAPPAGPTVHNAVSSTAADPEEVTHLVDNDLSSDVPSVQGWRSPISGWSGSIPGAAMVDSPRSTPQTTLEERVTRLVRQALQDFTAGLPTHRQQPRAERTDRELQPVNSQAPLWQGLGMSGLKSPPGAADHTGKTRAMPLPASMQRYDPELVKPRTEHAQDAYYSYWRATNRQAPIMGRPPITWTAANSQNVAPEPPREGRARGAPAPHEVAMPALMGSDKDRATKARWSAPEHIKPMSETTADFDWWFAQMHEHFRQCFIVNPVDQLTLLQTHCSVSFFRTIMRRATASGYPIHLMYNDLDTYQYFVCNYYTRTGAINDIMVELASMANKKLTPAEAWDELYRLQVCHDAKAARAGIPNLHEKTKIDFFIAAMKGDLRTFLFNMAQQAHPNVATAELTFDTAVQYELNRARYQGFVPEKDIDEGQQVLLAKKQSEGKPPAAAKKTPPKKRTAALAALANDTKEKEGKDRQKARIQCTFCKAKGHLVHQCRKRLSILRGRVGSSSEGNNAAPTATQEAPAMTAETVGKNVPSSAPIRPTCSFCGRLGHQEERCWLKHPHLRPARPRPASQQGKEEASSGESATTTAALAHATDIKRYKWDHPADSRAQEHTAHVALAQPIGATTLGLSETTASTAPSKQDFGPVVDPGKELCKCLLTVQATSGESELSIIVDTGATLNFIHPRFRSHLQEEAKVRPLLVKSVHDERRVVDTRGVLTLDIGGYPYVFAFYIIPHLPMDAILGMDAIAEAAWVIDATARHLYHHNHALPPIPLAPCRHTASLAYAQEETIISPSTWQWIPIQLPTLSGAVALCATPQCPAESPLFGSPVAYRPDSKTSGIKLLLCNPSPSPIEIPRHAPVAVIEPCFPYDEVQASLASTSESPGERHCQRIDVIFDLSTAKALWTDRDVKTLKRLLKHFSETWSNPHVIGKTTRCQHRIDTGDTPPVALPLRRIAWIERDRIEEEVQKMREQDVIVNSESPWSSPPVLVRKKDGSVRFCIDYRKLNECTTADKYPLPRIDDVLDALSEGRYFSVIDLKAGYWQIPMNAKDAEKTAFRTTNGLFHFKVMPFGLKNAPATFQRLMDTVFSGLKWHGLLVYMDDIVIYSATAQQHLALLVEVLVRLRAAGLKLNPAKTTLVRPEVKYLGHIVSAKGVQPDQAKVQAIRNLASPTSVRDIRRFLGLTGYYRKFMPQYATIAAPLYALTKKHSVFVWREEHEAAFRQLQELLCAAPTLAYPRRGRANIVDCDASDVAAGAVYMQRDEAGDECVIQYISCTFNDVQRRWPSVEREAYAVVWALTTFRPYLLGSHCTVRTDNSAAAAIKDAKQPKLQRWAVTLAEFDYTVEYRPANKQVHVDALSRLPVSKERGAGAPHVELPEAATAFQRST